jgi:hypothetical protein
MTGPFPFKLGRRRRPASDPRLPPLAPLTAAAPLPPERVLWGERCGEDWGMMGNDRVGDCTVAAAGHAILAWTAETDRTPVRMTADEALAAYGAITGYRPGDPASDRGAYCSEVLGFWAVSGLAVPGGGPDVLSGAAAFAPADLALLRQAVASFGVVYAGLALPLSAAGETVWQSTAEPPGSWGGHCVAVVGYDAEGPIAVSWGALKRMSWAFWQRYAEEAYALLSRDWIGAQGRDPAGFDWPALASALARLAEAP